MMYPRGTLVLANIQLGIYNWVKSVMDGVIPPEQILWRNQSEPLPPRPCVTMKIIDGPKPVGREGNVFNAAGQFSTVGVQEEMTVSIQIFGNSRVQQPMAYQAAVDLNSSLLDETVLTNLRLAGAAVQQVGDPRNITALEESEFEERAQFEVSFGLAQNIQTQPGEIDTVHGSGTVGGKTRTFTATKP